MIDVFVEASSPEAYAQIADLLRDSAQIRLIGADPGAPASSPEDALRPDVVVEVLEPIDPARASAESLSLNTGWSAAGVPVILLVDHLAQRLSGPLPRESTRSCRATLPRPKSPAPSKPPPPDSTSSILPTSSPSTPCAFAKPIAPPTPPPNSVKLSLTRF